MRLWTSLRPSERFYGIGDLRDLFEGKRVIHGQPQKAFALFCGVSVFAVESSETFTRFAAVEGNIMKCGLDAAFFQMVDEAASGDGGHNGGRRSHGC